MKNIFVIATLVFALPTIASATPALKTLTCGIWQGFASNKPTMLVVPVKELHFGKDTVLMADQKTTAYDGKISIEVSAVQADGTAMALFDTVTLSFTDNSKGISFKSSGSGMSLLNKQTADEDTAFINYIQDDPQHPSQAGLQVIVECKLK